MDNNRLIFRTEILQKLRTIHDIAGIVYTLPLITQMPMLREMKARILELTPIMDYVLFIATTEMTKKEYDQMVEVFESITNDKKI